MDREEGHEDGADVAGEVRKGRSGIRSLQSGKVRALSSGKIKLTVIFLYLPLFSFFP